MTSPNRADNEDIRANAAITKFLEYYVDPARPFDYAVMVEGPWGSGKTHLVKEFLKTSTSKPLYVTLNGVSSTEQIDQEFYRQLHPVLSHPGMRIAGAIARSVAKGALKMDFSKDESGTINISLPDIDLTKELANPRERLLIFDDLERCKMPISEVMGYINGFVEHDGLKVFVLANEAEITANGEPRYAEIKEKLIGQTLIVSAPGGEAFDAFLGQVSNRKTQDYLKRHKDAVLALHDQGGRGNLRTLKHAMWDFEKIGSQFEERHWSKEASVLKIMKVTMAITMEARAGNLNEADLSSLIGTGINRAMLAHVRKEKTKIDEIDERYPQVDFDDALLSANLLSSVLLRGEMQGPDIVGALDASKDYANPGAQPLWLEAMRVFNSDDLTCERIAGEVESAFAQREFTVRGEFMHIVGLRLWFAKIGLIPKKTDEVVIECKAYLDDLARKGLLETSLDRLKAIEPANTYGGYVIVESETEEWRQVAIYYDQVAKTVEQRQYPAIARNLVARLPTDPDGFLFDLAVNAVRTSPYWDHPVLASFPPDEYAKMVFTASPEIQSRAIEVLHSRHSNRLVDSLLPEKPWIAKVKAELEKLMVTAKPMTRYRLGSLIARNLDPLLPEEETTTGT